MKRLCSGFVPLLALLCVVFFAMMSVGCGGGSSTGDYQQNNGGVGWDIDPTPPRDNGNNQNNNTPSTPTNDTPTTPVTPTPNDNTDNNTNDHDNGQDNGNNSGGNDTPVAISGLWEVVSGSGTMTASTQSLITVNHLTYVPGMIGAIGVEVSRNTLGGTYEGAYCVTLKGSDLTQESIYPGTGIMTLYCTIDEYPERAPVQIMTFSGGMTFDYIGNNSYQSTDETEGKYMGVTQRMLDYSSTLTLENASTLKWTYWSKTELSGLGYTESLHEIVMRKVQ